LNGWDQPSSGNWNAIGWTVGTGPEWAFAPAKKSSGRLRIADLGGGCDDPRMTDLNNSEQRARSVVEGSGGIVRRRNPGEQSMKIEIAADAVWKVCILPLSYVGRRGDQMFYDVDLSAMHLPVFGG